jgi:hypothetical protein
MTKEFLQQFLRDMKSFKRIQNDEMRKKVTFQFSYMFSISTFYSFVLKMSRFIQISTRIFYCKVLFPEVFNF